MGGGGGVYVCLCVCVGWHGLAHFPVRKDLNCKCDPTCSPSSQAEERQRQNTIDLICRGFFLNFNFPLTMLPGRGVA